MREGKRVKTLGMISSPLIRVIAYKEANEAKTKRISERLDRQETDLFADTLFCADKNEVDRSMLPDGQDLPQGKNAHSRGAVANCQADKHCVCVWGGRTLHNC